MAIISLLIFSLSTSLGGFQISDPLLTFSSQNPNDPLLFITVHVFVYFLIPLTFFLSMLLFLCHLTTPNTNYPLTVFFLNNLPIVTRALSLVTLLLGVSLMATYSYSIPLDQSIVSLCLVAVIIHIGTTVHRTPPLFALCISVGSLLFAESLSSYTQQFPYNALVNIPIYIFIYIQIPFTFMLSMTLLLSHVAVPGFSVEHLEMAVRGMVITDLLVGACAMAYLGFGDSAVIGGGGGTMEIGVY